VSPLRAPDGRERADDEGSRPQSDREPSSAESG